MGEAATISVLPDDCLRAIFFYIPIFERVKLREVCKTWRDVCDDCWQEARSLDIFFDSCRTSPLARSRGNAKMISVHTSINKVATTVTQLCAPYLRRFHSSRFINALLLSSLQESANIETFIVSTCLDTSSEVDLLLGGVLKTNERLKDLSIVVRKNGTCLRQLHTDYLEKLNITFDSRIRYNQNVDEYFKSMLQHVIDNAKKLKRLRLQGPNGRDLPVFNHVSSVTELIIVNYQSNPCYFTNDQLNNIITLSNLTELAILINSNSLINDEFLINLCESCKALEVVHFGRCSTVTNRGLKTLSLLPQLKKLNVDETYETTGGCISYFTTIEDLCIMHTKMTETDVIELLRNCQSLKKVDLYGSNVNFANMKCLLQDLVKQRKTCVPLNHVRIDHTDLIFNGILK